jgi:hypothetical protein
MYVLLKDWRFLRVPKMLPWSTMGLWMGDIGWLYKWIELKIWDCCKWGQLTVWIWRIKCCESCSSLHNQCIVTIVRYRLWTWWSLFWIKPWCVLRQNILFLSSWIRPLSLSVVFRRCLFVIILCYIPKRSTLFLRSSSKFISYSMARKKSIFLTIRRFSAYSRFVLFLIMALISV